MKKTTIAAADFQRKPYVQPQNKVVEIKEADIICASTENPEEEPFPWGA